MAYTFDDADAPSGTHTQYFEMIGNRGDLPRRLDGADPPPHAVGSGQRSRADFDDDIWELYDTTTDWTQANDLAKENPEKLAELQQLFLIEATQVQRAPARRSCGPAHEPRVRRAPDPRAGRPPAAVPGHDSPQRERRHQREEPLVLGDRPDRGRRRRRARASSSPRAAAPAAGAFFAEDGKLAYHYNFCGLQRTTVARTDADPRR